MTASYMTADARFVKGTERLTLEKVDNHRVWSSAFTVIA